MTKAKRAIIYRAAAEFMDSRPSFTFFRNDYTYCCRAIARVRYGDGGEYARISKKNFPELYQFEPSEKLFPADNGWWGCGDDSIQPRIIALLLCAEMCESK